MFKEYRVKKGLTQEMLGFKANLDTRTIQRIEYGEMIPSIKKLSKLKNALM